MIEILRELCLRLGNNISNAITTTKVLRQGYSLWPSFFNIYVECVLLEWMKACRGTGVTVDGTFMFTLNFPDDQILTAQNEFDLEFMLKHLVRCIITGT
jgi:hypothetical protein